jgi:hypothetical protein
MDSLSLAQTLPHKIKVPLWGGDRLGRFLLKRMKHIQDTLKAHGIDGPVGVAVEIFANFPNATAKTFEWLGAGGMVSHLRFEKGLTDLAPDFPREGPQVFPAGADENSRLDHPQ